MQGLDAARLLCELPAQLSWQQCCHLLSDAKPKPLGCEGYVLHVPVFAAAQAAAWTCFAPSHTHSTLVCTWQLLSPMLVGLTRVSLCVRAFQGLPRERRCAVSTGTLLRTNQGIVPGRGLARQFGGDVCACVDTGGVLRGCKLSVLVCVSMSLGPCVSSC
jgi:hypothetical protein